MDIHEYQGKEILASFGIKIPEGMLIRSQEEAKEAYQKLGPVVAVKAQLLAGGRGKAGGVAVIKTEKELLKMVDRLLSKNLVTYQTTEKGLPVNALLIEKGLKIKKELYLAFLINRKTRSVTIMASEEGGVEIEKVAEKTPDKIHKVQITTEKLEGFQARWLGFSLGLEQEQLKQFIPLLHKLYQAFCEKDMSMLEINPLVILEDGNMVCLDTKVNIDDNALYRQPDILAMRDTSQEDPKEVEASKNDLSYIALDGEIGCMVNGAGLAMATMDMIQVCGGRPANFLDVGGDATEQRVTEAFKIIEQDENVKVIFVNIFGGIVRCDLIAEGIIQAIDTLGLSKPIVVRLVGNNAKEGNVKLDESNFKVEAVSDFKKAAVLAVEKSKGEA